jgi:acyl dehydratase
MALDPAKLHGRPPDRTTQRYGAKDTILYALGVGAGQADPCDPRELQFVYEPRLRALPTMAVVLASEPFWMAEPEWGLDWRRIVHGEQTLLLHRELPTEGCVSGETRIAGIYDKGAAGALIHLERTLRDEHGELLAQIGKTALLRGAGGFGGDPDLRPREPGPPAPERGPDAGITLGTRPEQALIYRLPGDLNPLHVDPAVAGGAGFPRPILHGLCTYGVACRGLMRLFCDGDPGRVRRLDVRFSSPIYPGEALRIEAWVSTPGQAAFRGVAVERGVVVLANGHFAYDA